MLQVRLQPDMSQYSQQGRTLLVPADTAPYINQQKHASASRRRLSLCTRPFPCLYYACRFPRLVRAWALAGSAAWPSYLGGLWPWALLKGGIPSHQSTWNLIKMVLEDLLNFHLQGPPAKVRLLIEGRVHKQKDLVFDKPPQTQLEIVEVWVTP